MQQRTLTIRNQRGLHARAASKFVKMASQFSADITVSKDGQTVSGRSIMGLMMLAAGIGATIDVTCSGVDEVDAMNVIDSLIDDKFGEEC
jgi:phosphocarrier protein